MSAPLLITDMDGAEAYEAGLEGAARLYGLDPDKWEDSGQGGHVIFVEYYMDWQIWMAASEWPIPVFVICDSVGWWEGESTESLKEAREAVGELIEERLADREAGAKWERERKAYEARQRAEEERRAAETTIQRHVAEVAKRPPAKRLGLF